MIRTRPKGKVENIKPTKTKSNVNKILNKSESDKSPSPNKIKASLDSPKKIKTPPSSPVKIKILSLSRLQTQAVSKPASDTSSIQKVNLDINLTYVHIYKSKIKHGFNSPYHYYILLDNYKRITTRTSSIRTIS